MSHFVRLSRSTHKHSILLLVITFVMLSSCGRQLGPIVESAEDVNSLPLDTTIVRARALADEDIPSLRRLEKLEAINFGGGWKVEEAKISDIGLKNLSQLYLTTLRYVRLEHNSLITDEGLHYLAQMKQLTFIRLDWCPRLTDAGVDKLRKALPSCKVLFREEEADNKEGYKSYTSK